MLRVEFYFAKFSDATRSSFIGPGHVFALERIANLRNHLREILSRHTLCILHCNISSDAAWCRVTEYVERSRGRKEKNCSEDRISARRSSSWRRRDDILPLIRGKATGANRPWLYYRRVGVPWSSWQLFACTRTNTAWLTRLLEDSIPIAVTTPESPDLDPIIVSRKLRLGRCYIRLVTLILSEFTDNELATIRFPTERSSEWNILLNDKFVEMLR